MFATHPRMAKRWADETPNMKKLPEKVKKASPEEKKVSKIQRMRDPVSKRLYSVYRYSDGSSFNPQNRQTDKIEGGLADHMKSSDFPKKELMAGQKVEKEHTKDPSIAKEIAKDHLAEDSDYYKKLKKMEKSAFSKMAGSLKKKMTRKYC